MTKVENNRDSKRDSKSEPKSEPNSDAKNLSIADSIKTNSKIKSVMSSGQLLNITDFEIEGPKLFEPKMFADDRGFFSERFKINYSKEIGLPEVFVQDNFSRSNPGVLRGLHYQWDQPQGKLVTALRGKIYDVAVDIRKNSPTFGKYISVILDGDRPQWFWIPAGFAHGFCVVGDESADVMYKVDNLYNAKGEAGIIFNDPDLNIQWPVEKSLLLLSPKDTVLQSLSEYSSNPKF